VTERARPKRSSATPEPLDLVRGIDGVCSLPPVQFWTSNGRPFRGGFVGFVGRVEYVGEIQYVTVTL
jgi:hypothetical protein